MLEINVLMTLFVLLVKYSISTIYIYSFEGYFSRCIILKDDYAWFMKLDKGSGT